MRRDGFGTRRAAERRATTIGSRGTGKRVHDVFFDDPNDTKEVSGPKLEAVWDSYRLTFQNRLKNMSTGGRCLIQQRTHAMRDLSGMLANEDGEAWRRVVIRQEFEPGDTGRIPGSAHRGGRTVLPGALPSRRGGLGKARPGASGVRWPAPTAPRAPRRRNVQARPNRGGRRGTVGPQDLPGWDQAATMGGGDHTVGALLGKASDGTWWILDIARQQTAEPRAMLKQVAAMDGKAVPISWPQDPGAAGKDQARSLTSDLAGYTFHTSPETGAKEIRWEPFASQVNGGNVKMVRAPWNRLLLEDADRPRGAHDDQLDALARAFGYLTGGVTGLLDYYRQQAAEARAAGPGCGYQGG